MEYPKLNLLPTSRYVTDRFLGYNHNLRLGDGEFYEMENMTSDHCPILAPRGKRGVFATYPNARALIGKDTLCFVDGADFVVGESRLPLGLTEGKKQLVSMGAYVLIFPDRKYVNTADLTDAGSIEAAVSCTGSVTFTPCTQEGAPQSAQFIQATPPEDPENNCLWVDTSGPIHVRKQYSAETGQWVAEATAYVKIAAPGIGGPFAQFDGVRLGGLGEQTPQLAALEGAAIVQDRGEDHLVVAGILDESQTVTLTLTVRRVMPELDFVVESRNRLWGCRYGPDDSGAFVNRLYASKLGDFKNWECYMGLSTDSYYANLGTDGGFTGAITYLGYPLFFKENMLHQVFGDYPAQFRVMDTACRGVQAGCEKSLAIVNEILYYKARHAVCAYDGSLPVEVSAALGDERYGFAVAGAIGNKYYVSMEGSGGHVLFVYDTARSLWHKEDDLWAEDFAVCQGELYCLEHGTGRILALLGSGEQEKGSVPWMVETGILGTNQPDRKYISRLNVRMSMDVGGRARFFVQYDSMGGWEHLGTVNVTSLKSFSLPIRPRRCDHLRLRIEGVGDARIYSITKTTEQGSDIS